LRNRRYWLFTPLFTAKHGTIRWHGRENPLPTRCIPANAGLEADSVHDASSRAAPWGVFS
jgi:hypothetical protein